MARRSSHQRERYGRDHRDPLRRQRSARRPGRLHGQRRSAGAALRRRRALRRAARWQPAGEIDPAAVAALWRGKSLLPAGVTRVEGTFSRGDVVVVRGPDGGEVGRGLSAYDAEEAGKIMGKSSGDILLILGFAGRAAMIHRDDLVLG